MLYCIARRSRAGVNTQFVVNRSQVCVDGAGAEHEALGHLGITQTLSNEAQDFDLAFCQLVQPFYLPPLVFESLRLHKLSRIRETQRLPFFIKLIKLLLSELSFDRGRYTLILTSISGPKNKLFFVGFQRAKNPCSQL